MEGTLKILLDQLHQGDQAAAEMVFLQFEPVLRLMVRRQLTARLRSKFDSADIVQSVWVDLLDGFRAAAWRFTDAAHLRNFLLKATRHRFIDRLRQHRNALKGQRSLDAFPNNQLASPPAEDGTAQVQVEDLWLTWLQNCPATHRQVLLLKRDGHKLADIAQQTGLHPSSVRRILYDFARRLSQKQAVDR